MALGDVINGAGQAIQDLFGSEGASAEANSFTTAAQLADQNATLTAASTRIQETQTARQIFQTEGTQIADVAGAGFTESGSALDLLRSSAQQGSLSESLTNIQGAINENSYAAQAGAFRGEAAAANEKSNANTVGAIAAIGGALVNNSNSLVSAGKTVVQGVRSIFSGSSDDELSTAIAGSDADELSGAMDLSDLDEAFAADDMSALDEAIAGGSDLSEGLASADIGLDTSGIDIGTDLASADSGIGSIFSGLSDSISGYLGDVSDFASSAWDVGSGLASNLSDILPGIGFAVGISNLLDMIPGWSSIPVLGDITQGISSAAGAVTGAVVGAVEDAGSAIGGALSDVGDAIGGALGSVICTAYHQLGFIRHRTFVGDTLYGIECPRVVFDGYLLWAKPVAAQILKRPWVAKLLWPIFKPTIYEMAAQTGFGNSTVIGRVSLKIFTAFSWCAGYFLTSKKGKSHAIKA